MADPYDLPPGAKIISVPQQYDLPPGAKIVEQQPRADRGGMGPGEPDLPPSRSWGDAAQSAVSEFLPSLGHQLSGLYDAVTSPVQTAKALGSVAEGGLSKLGNVTQEESAQAAERLKLLQGGDPKKPVMVPGLGMVVPELVMPRLQEIASYNDPEKVAARQQIEQNFDLVKEHYVNRYGSLDGLKEAIAKDPAGVLLDLSTVLTLGGGLARGAGSVANAVSQGSKVANVATKAGEVLGAAGKATDPIAQTLGVAGKAVKGAGNLAVEGLGVTTGVGGAPIKTAFDVAREATANNPFSMRVQDNFRRLKEALRGNSDPAELVSVAQDGLNTMRSDASHRFETAKNGPNGWAGDTNLLPFQPIRDAYDKVYASLFSRSNGKPLIRNKAEMDKIEEIGKLISEWEDNYAGHTLGGLDDLKKALWSLKGTAETPQLNRVVGQLHGQIKQIVNRQSDILYNGKPNLYRRSQRDWERTMNTLDEIERSLSLGKRATNDTATRKLLSVMRDNVHTNYGQRVKGVETLEDLGGVDLLPDLAGMSLASKAPRGLMRTVLGADLIGSLGAGLAINPKFAWLAAGVPFTSPRLAGEAAVLAGQGAGAYDRFVGKHLDKLPSGLAGHPTTLGVGQAAEMNDLVGRKRGGHLRTLGGR